MLISIPFINFPRSFFKVGCVRKSAAFAERRRTLVANESVITVFYDVRVVETFQRVVESVVRFFVVQRVFKEFRNGNIAISYGAIGKVFVFSDYGQGFVEIIVRFFEIARIRKRQREIIV